MSKLQSVEQKIGKLEGFSIRIRHLDGRDVRSDLKDLPSYPFKRKLTGTMTVSDWKSKRFRVAYPGYRCDVLRANGKPVVGNTLLDNVRQTYITG